MINEMFSTLSELSFSGPRAAERTKWLGYLLVRRETGGSFCRAWLDLFGPLKPQDFFVVVDTTVSSSHACDGVRGHPSPQFM